MNKNIHEVTCISGDDCANVLLKRQNPLLPRIGGFIETRKHDLILSIVPQAVLSVKTEYNPSPEARDLMNTIYRYLPKSIKKEFSKQGSTDVANLSSTDALAISAAELKRRAREASEKQSTVAALKQEVSV